MKRLIPILGLILMLIVSLLPQAAVAERTRFLLDAERPSLHVLGVDTVAATDDAFEDRIELTWAATVDDAASFKVVRDGVLLTVLASSERAYTDLSALPNTDYDYCLIVTDANGVDEPPVCDLGRRSLRKPSGLIASNATRETDVLLDWLDRSEIEDGYYIFREGSPFDTLAANASLYADTTAMPGTLYEYCVAAFVVEQDVAYASDQTCANGERAFVTPPAAVAATDGQYIDRARITWEDQAAVESQFTIYRDGVQIGTVPADSTRFDDFNGTPAMTHDYCVTATAGGMESVMVCDEGRQGGLTPPANVAASFDTFDDRVEVTWDDAADTEDGFEVFRAGTLIATVGANEQRYDDFEAAQNVAYEYCVRAFSLVDPNNPSYSDDACDTGRRAYVLTPTNLAISQGDFEDRVALTWANPSTTALLFKVYRGPDANTTALIATVPPEQLSFNDFETASDETAAYCVAAVTNTGTAPVESAPVCATGFRALEPPTSVDATFGDFEDHIEVTWVDESGVEDGYRIYRQAPTAATFDGSTGAVIVPDEAAFDFAGSSFTVETWFRTDGFTTTHEPLITKGDHTWRVQRAGASSHLTFDTNHPGGNGLAGTTAVDDGAWHHVAAVFDAAQQMKYLYVDGQLDASGAFTGALSMDDFDVGFGFNTEMNKFFGGQLAEVRLWNGARAEAEIQAAMHQALAGVEAGLLGYWPLAEAPAGVVRDAAGGRDGMIQGGVTFDAPGAPGLLAGQVGASRASFGDYTGTPGVAYTYVVRTFDGYAGGLTGDSQNGVYASASDTTGFRRLAAASFVQADENASEMAVTITWQDNSRAETGYLILRDGILLATLGANATSYADSTGTFGSSFLYAVVAFDAYGTSEAVSDQGGTAILPPLSVNASDVYTDRVQLTWVDQSAINDGYRITRDGIVVADTLTGDEATWTDPDAVAGMTHEYCVEATAGGAGSVPACDSGIRVVPTATESDGDVRVSDFLATGITPSTNNPLAIDGDYAVVTDDPSFLQSGVAHFFKRTGTTWTEQQAAGSTVNAVALDGNYAALGFSGGIEIFERDGDTWISQAQLLVGDAANAVAIDGNYALMGGGGKVRVFKRSGANWTLDTTLQGDSGTGNYGTDVALDGDYAVVGASLEAPKGVAYVYHRTGNTWSFQEKLTTTDAEALEFGFKVDILGDYILVSAVGDIFAGRQGDAYIFKRQGTTWNQQIHLTPTAEDQLEYYGFAIDLDDTYAFVGGYGGGPENAGAVVVYRREDDTWGRIARLLPDDFEGTNSSTGFGSSVSVVDGDFIGGTVAGEVVYHQGLVITPDGVTATDGFYTDRIQVTWADNNRHEDGYNVYRRDEAGVLQRIGATGANQGLFNDFSAAPGNGYEYCVTAFNNALDAEEPLLGESTARCNTGWRPANGSISGRVASSGGGGTEDVAICPTPNLNKALLFDGSAGFVNIPHQDLLDVTNTLTVEAWIRPAKLTGIQRIAAKSGTYGFGLNDNGLRFTTYGVKDYDLSLGTLTVGQWVHVAAVLDASNDVTFFVNGQDVGVVQGDTPANTSTVALRLGQSGNMTEYFQGQMDEVRLWNVARSPAEIADNRATPLQGDEAGLIGYWPLDQGARRVAPDLTGSGHNGALEGGVYWSDDSAPLIVCALTDLEGNYTLSGLHYNTSAEFIVTPSLGNRSFTPAFRTVTLSTESPVQNQVDFIDQTAFSVSGLVQFAGTTCPVEGVEVYVDDQLKGTTESDGSYLVAVDPSLDDQDLRSIEPRFVNLQDASDIHDFNPAQVDLFIEDNIFDTHFTDTKKRTLSGFVGGGCGFDIGTVTLKIFTQNGCFEQEVQTVNGRYDVALPPQAYLVQVIAVDNIPAGLDVADIVEFFDNLGAMEADLTLADDTLDIFYRAPIDVGIAGFEAKDASSCTDPSLQVVDAQGRSLREVLRVPVLEQPGKKIDPIPLTITVHENYGLDAGGNPQLCPVADATVTVFDETNDQEGGFALLTDSTGIARYTEDQPMLPDRSAGPLAGALYQTYANTPNVAEGRTVDGVDRSFQKSFTAVADIPGRASVTETAWVIVAGGRPRTGTFSTLPTTNVPLHVLRDPPGDGSFSSLTKGETVCSTFKIQGQFTLEGHTSFQVLTGTQFEAGFFGISIETDIEAKPGFKNTLSGTLRGGGAFESCMTLGETISTSSAAAHIGPEADVYVGVGTNFLFALSDELSRADDEACTLELSEAARVGLDEDQPFETLYTYTQAHIKNTVLPQLESLKELSPEDSTQLNNAITTWEAQLDYNQSERILAFGNCDFIPDNDARAACEDLLEERRERLLGTEFSEILRENCAERFQTEEDRDACVEDAERAFDDHFFPRTFTNRSFDAGATYTYTHSESDTDTGFGGIDVSFKHAFTYDFKGEVGNNGLAGSTSITVGLGASFDFSNSDTDRRTVTYVLHDNDPGDFFSVDVVDDLAFTTPIFRLVSGRSSNPFEFGTQPRDSVIVQLNPPVARDVPADGRALFTLSLTNASPSGEERFYTLRSLSEFNPGAAVIRAQSSFITGGMLFTLGPNETQEVTVQVSRGPERYRYENLAIMAYPPGEYSVWQDGGLNGNGIIQLADTVFFDVFFQPPCSDISILRPKEHWTLNAATVGDMLEVILHEFSLTVSETEAVEALGLEYRLQGTSDWLPAVDVLTSTLDPGATSWTAQWPPPEDGNYEVRAFTSCPLGGKVFSDPIPGVVDTLPPEVFGLPDPADAFLSLGDGIAVTFDEEIACESVSAQGPFPNLALNYLNDDQTLGAAIPFEAACNGTTLILNPLEDDATLENHHLRARVLAGVEDAQGNPQVVSDLLGNGIASTVAWDFLVQKSAVAWAPVNLTVEVSRGFGGLVTPSLVNGRPDLVGFSLPASFDLLQLDENGNETGTVATISPSMTAGEIVSGGAQPIDIEIPDTLDLGRYTALLTADLVDAAQANTPSLGQTLFYLDVNVLCRLPVEIFPVDLALDPNTLGADLTAQLLNPSNFQYTMTVTAQLFVDGEASVDENDAIIARVGDELRGFGFIQEVLPGTYRANLLLYSNVDSGEVVTFHVWDHDACTFFEDASPALAFTADAIRGTPEQPLTIQAPPATGSDQAVAFNTGWTWFSINKLPDDNSVNAVLAGLNPADNDEVKSQTAFSRYFDGLGWVGALSAIDPGPGYQIRLSESGTFLLSGADLDVANTPIALAAGWNWVGYLPPVRYPVDWALGVGQPHGLDVSRGDDLIKSQIGFAQFVEGAGWIGSLEELAPGGGYLLNVAEATTLTYPGTAPPSSQARLAAQEQLKASQATGKKATAAEDEDSVLPDLGPDWTVDAAAYRYSMTITARLHLDGLPLTEPRTRLGAFIDGELRGVAPIRYVPSLETHLAFLMVYSDHKDGEDVTFRLFDPRTETIHETPQTLAYQADAMIGKPTEPMTFDTGAAKAGQAAELPDHFALEQNYPNPFNPVTTIAYTLPQAERVQLIVFDVLGREVLTLVDGVQKDAGRYEVAFDASRLASGLYFYRIKAGSFAQVKRMVLLK